MYMSSKVYKMYTEDLENGKCIDGDKRVIQRGSGKTILLEKVQKTISNVYRSN